jgi:hypothetical protein
MSAAQELVELDTQALEQVLLPSREQILTLETRMREFDQIDCPLTHTFAPGSYARTIVLPKGALVVGKIHKHAHLNIVSKGRVTVVTEFGRMGIEGPHVFTSQPGTKRALYVHEECVWTTIHLTDSTDLAEIERDIIARDFVELDAFMARECAQLIDQETDHAE